MKRASRWIKLLGGDDQHGVCSRHGHGGVECELRANAACRPSGTTSPAVWRAIPALCG